MGEKASDLINMVADIMRTLRAWVKNAPIGPIFFFQTMRGIV